MGEEFRFVHVEKPTAADDGSGDVFELSDDETPSVIELTDVVLDGQASDTAGRRGEASGMMYADASAIRNCGEDETEDCDDAEGGAVFQAEDEVDLFDDEESEEKRASFSFVTDDGKPVGTGLVDAAPDDAPVEARLQAVSEDLATLAAIIEESEQVRKGQATLIAERFDQLSAAVAVNQATAGDRREDEALSDRLMRMSQKCELMLSDLRKEVDGVVEAFETYRQSERDRLDGILSGFETRLALLEQRPEAVPLDIDGIVGTVSSRLDKTLEQAAAAAAARVIREELAKLV